MKAQNIKTANQQGQLCGYTSDGRRERIAMMVIAPGIDEWRLLGHMETKGEYTVLERGQLRAVVLEAERHQASFPDVILSAPYLAPEGIRGYQRKDVRRDGGWAFGVKCEPIDFRNADDLYHFLRSNGYWMEGNQGLRECQDTRFWLFRSGENTTSDTAWEIAHHRLENNGQLPPHLEVPAGTCPQCLSRFVAMPWGGETFYCLECFYAS